MFLLGPNSKTIEMLSQGNVVIVEPTENYRKTLQRYLLNLKVKSIKFCDSLQSAKIELATTKASLIIVEWQQPGNYNGLQFCREIRKDKKLRDIPFMLLSVESLRGDVVLASEVGIDGYVLKPFSYEEFCEQLSLLFKKAQERCNFTALVEQAEEMLNEGKLREAEMTFLECRDHDGQSARAQCGIGRIRLHGGQEVAALECFKSALEKNPTYLEAYRLILEIYELKDQPHHTLHYALKAHELSPENPRYMLLCAKAYLEINDLDSSEKFFRKTIRVSPSLAEGHKGLGDVHLLKEDYDQAMKYYRKALDLDGNDVGILNAIGLVYVRQEKFADGIKQYMLALRIDAGNEKVLFNLGYAYEKLDKLVQAKEYYDKALIKNPEFDKARRGLLRIQGSVKLLRIA